MSLPGLGEGPISCWGQLRGCVGTVGFIVIMGWGEALRGKKGDVVLEQMGLSLLMGRFVASVAAAALRSDAATTPLQCGFQSLLVPVWRRERKRCLIHRQLVCQRQPPCPRTHAAAAPKKHPPEDQRAEDAHKGRAPRHGEGVKMPPTCHSEMGKQGKRCELLT